MLSLYIDKGLNFVNEIDGDFSIAIWEDYKNQLILIRDRVGCKPLFFHKTDKSILFSSEIKGITNSGLYSKDVNLTALNSFLSYWYIPNPETLFKSIHQVKPGHMAIFKNGNYTEKKYWKFEYKHNFSEIKEQALINEFLDIFTNAVSRRLAKYPDSGSFLSGGLDSSSVAVILSKLAKNPIKVFSAGFKEEQYNEIEDAKVVSDHLGVGLYSVVLDYPKDFYQLLSKLVWHHDSPFADTSAIPSFYAAKLAKKYVDVVFTGDFPDQLLGGSGHHASALEKEKESSIFQKFLRRDFINFIVSNIPLSSGSASFFDRFKRFIYRESFPIEQQRIISNMQVPELLKRRLYNPEMLMVNKQNNPLDFAKSLYEDVKDHSLLDKILYFDIMSYAPDDLMVKVDRMTSAHGLVAISPFHDIELLRFVEKLPTKFKINNQDRKYIMREAMRPMLPKHTMNKNKKGFDMPIEDWLIKKDPDFVADLLLDSKTINRGYFNKHFYQDMIINFLNGKNDYASGNSATIISLITLELWHRIFIDG